MARQRRSSDEWQRLIEEFEAGSESSRAFCLRHSISPSNFYKRRSTRMNAPTPSFVEARRAAPPSCPVTVQVGDVAIRCDAQTPVVWVSALVAALRG